MSEDRHFRAEYERGKNANLAGKPRDKKQNADWLLGWDTTQADRRLDEDDGEHR